jgi:hypothetical protein
MTKMTETYNYRLFEESWPRRMIHNSRFEWFRNTMASLYGSRAVSCIELGCFDGRLLDYFPISPCQYFGFDAGWEGGLDAAQARYHSAPGRIFRKATLPSELAGEPDASCDVAVALETLEHVPPDSVDGYLQQLARIAKGHLLVSAPNEIGPVFLAKYLAKKAYFGSAQAYRPSEVLWATLARMNKVERDDHKGFDYRLLAVQVAKYFDIVHVGGLPFHGVPPALSITVTILAKARRN